MHIASVCVGVFAAGFRSYLINAAVIICSEKRAGEQLQYLIAVLVGPEVLFGKRCGTHPQVLRNYPHIFMGEERARRFAAIRAFEAIGTRKYFIVCLAECDIHIARFAAAK